MFTEILHRLHNSQIMTLNPDDATDIHVQEPKKVEPGHAVRKERMSSAAPPAYVFASVHYNYIKIKKSAKTRRSVCLHSSNNFGAIIRF